MKKTILIIGLLMAGCATVNRTYNEQNKPRYIHDRNTGQCFAYVPNPGRPMERNITPVQCTAEVVKQAEADLDK